MCWTGITTGKELPNKVWGSCRWNVGKSLLRLYMEWVEIAAKFLLMKWKSTPAPFNWLVILGPKKCFASCFYSIVLAFSCLKIGPNLFEQLASYSTPYDTDTNLACQQCIAPEYCSRLVWNEIEQWAGTKELLGHKCAQIIDIMLWDATR